MYKIVTRRQLNDAVVLMEIDAPYIAAKAEAGQFIIYRVDEKGERVPLTIADYDREKGTITIIFQVVGASTTELARLNEGDYIHDVVGPLGVATEYDEGIKRVAVVGGGVGCAIAYPQAKKLHSMGVEVDLIAGSEARISLSSRTKWARLLHIFTSVQTTVHTAITDLLQTSFRSLLTVVLSLTRSSLSDQFQ